MFRKAENEHAGLSFWGTLGWVVTLPFRGVYNVTTQVATTAIDTAGQLPSQTSRAVLAVKEKVYPSYSPEDYQQAVANINKERRAPVIMPASAVVSVEAVNKPKDKVLDDYLARVKAHAKILQSERQSCSLAMLFNSQIPEMKRKKVEALNQLSQVKNWHDLKKTAESILNGPDADIVKRGFIRHQTRDLLEDCLRAANTALNTRNTSSSFSPSPAK